MAAAAAGGGGRAPGVPVFVIPDGCAKLPGVSLERAKTAKKAATKVLKLAEWKTRTTAHFVSIVESLLTAAGLVPAETVPVKEALDHIVTLFTNIAACIDSNKYKDTCELHAKYWDVCYLFDVLESYLAARDHATASAGGSGVPDAASAASARSAIAAEIAVKWAATAAMADVPWVLQPSSPSEDAARTAVAHVVRNAIFTGYNTFVRDKLSGMSIMDEGLVRKVLEVMDNYRRCYQPIDPPLFAATQTAEEARAILGLAEPGTRSAPASGEEDDGGGSSGAGAGHMDY